MAKRPTEVTPTTSTLTAATTEVAPKAKRIKAYVPPVDDTVRVNEMIERDDADTAAVPVIRTTGDIRKDMLIDLVSSLYQVQKLRIQLGNKLVAHFYRKLGIDAAQTLIEQQKGANKAKVDFIDVLKVQYRRITDALAEHNVIERRQFIKVAEKARGVFDEFTEFSQMTEYRQLLSSENRILKSIEESLEGFPIWTEFLNTSRVSGPRSVVLSSPPSISTRQNPLPAFMRFAGLDVVPINNKGVEDNRGRGRYREHLVKVNYIDKDGKDAVRDSITFSPTLKTKLVGVLANIFIKQNTPVYRKEYDDYKARITERENVLEKEAKASGNTKFKKRTPGHLNAMAKRYCIKILLIHIYQHWRALEGLEVVPDYYMAKLSSTPHHVADGRWSQMQRGETPVVVPQEAFATEEDDTPSEF